MVLIDIIDIIVSWVGFGLLGGYILWNGFLILLNDTCGTTFFLPQPWYLGGSSRRIINIITSEIPIDETEPTSPVKED